MFTSSRVFFKRSPVNIVLKTKPSTPIPTRPLTTSYCLFSTSKMATFPTPSSERPKHEMQYFPNMLNALPSESGDFRRVLHTGLYSQLVLMTIPVGGDIGEEVRDLFTFPLSLCVRVRSTPAVYFTLHPHSQPVPLIPAKGPSHNSHFDSEH